jgi:hypothetical protein
MSSSKMLFGEQQKQAKLTSAIITLIEVSEATATNLQKRRLLAVQLAATH